MKQKMARVILFATGLICLVFFQNATLSNPPTPATEISLAQRQRPQSPLYNSACSQINPSQLSWFETFGQTKLAGSPISPFAVQFVDGWFYLWDQPSSSAPSCNAGDIYGKPVVSAPLLNSAGDHVLGSSLAFLGMMDLKGNGKNYLVGIQGVDTNWVYVWFINRSKRTLELVANGALTNAQGTIIPAGVFRSVVIGDFGNTGADKIRALQKGGSYNYTWTVNLNNQNSLGNYPLFSSGPLQNGSGQPVNVDDLNFVDVAVLDSADPSNLSNPGETVLVAIQGNDWVYEWGVNPRSEYEIPLCTNDRCKGKSVLFSSDQGYANGLLRYSPGNLNLGGAYANVINSLKSFQNAGYKVSVILNPIDLDTPTHTQLYLVLSLLQKNNIPFYFDVYASDTTTIGLVQQHIDTPFSLTNKQGLSIDLNTLATIRSDFGASFAGLRIFETGSFDYMENKCLANFQPWCPPQNILLPNFFTQSAAQPYVSFAHTNHMQALVVDQMFLPPWGETGNDTYKRFNAAISNLASIYPGTVTLAYENNEKTYAFGSPLHRLNTWDQSTLMVPGSAGLGISNQTWICDNNKPGFNTSNCPPEYLEIWTASAFLKKGASVVQFEPFWSFFNWPMGQMADSIPPVPTATSTNGLGSPTASLCALAKSMGVILANCPP